MADTTPGIQKLGEALNGVLNAALNAAGATTGLTTIEKCGEFTGAVLVEVMKRADEWVPHMILAIRRANATTIVDAKPVEQPYVPIPGQ